MSAPDPFETVPEGWTLQVEPANRWNPEIAYITRDDGSLGEHGMIVYDEERGGYLVPGASEAFQGPYATLDQVIEAVQR